MGGGWRSSLVMGRRTKGGERIRARCSSGGEAGRGTVGGFAAPKGVKAVPLHALRQPVPRFQGIQSRRRLCQEH